MEHGGFPVGVQRTEADGLTKLNNNIIKSILLLELNVYAPNISLLNIVKMFPFSYIRRASLSPLVHF